MRQQFSKNGSNRIDRKEQSFVKRLKRKSPQAFEELIQTYACRLHSVGMRVLHDPEDSEDVVQETFLKAFQSIKSFREESSLYTWMCRIMINQSVMKLRQVRKHRPVPIEPYLTRFEQGQDSQGIGVSTRPDLMLDGRELARFFEKCIIELPQKYRSPFILKDVEKLSEDQVCEALQIPKSVMKNSVYRARLIIRQRVGDRFVKRAGWNFQMGSPFLASSAG